MTGKRDFFMEFMRTWWWALTPWWLFLYFAHHDDFGPGLFCLFLASLLWVVRFFKGQVCPSRWSLILFFVSSRLPTFFSASFCEDDYYRYIWDGIVSLQGDNALVIAPQEVLLQKGSVWVSEADQARRQEKIKVRAGYMSHDELEELLLRVNHPESPSIYGPTAQLFLALSSAPLKLLEGYSPSAIPLSWRVHQLRFFLLLVDAGLCFLLLSSFPHQAGAVMLYVSCPLLLKEVGNSLHIDILSIALSCCALRALYQAQIKRASLFLALCCGVKLYALVLLPLYWLVAARNWKIIWMTLGFMVLLYLPWVLSGGEEIWAGTRYFSFKWSMNDLYTALWREFFYHYTEVQPIVQTLIPFGEIKTSGAQFWARAGGLLTYLVYVVGHLLRYAKCADPKSQTLFCLTNILLGLWWFSPVLNPWYLLWLLPFAILARHKVALCFITLAPCYLFNFQYTATSHIFHPVVQWWVLIPHFLAGGILLWTMFKPKSYLNPQE
jgi:hypothetical protein